ncbi:MAG: O-antigen ligase family protein [Clostridium sp.]|nr:O-antigen ligase family protein [Clostridium sp.]
MKKKQVKKKQRSLAADIQTVLLWVLRGISFFYLIMMGVVLPFYYHPETSYMTIGSGKAEFYNKWAFGTAKAAGVFLLLYLLTASVRQFLLWKKDSSRKTGETSLWMAMKTGCQNFWQSLTGTELFAVCYIAALCISYLLTDYPEFAKMGADGWNMGFWPQILFLFFFLLLERTLTTGMAKAGIGMMLSASTVVFLLGLLNRYGVNPLHMESSGPGFISTIGNINWYCGYWSVLFPVCCGIFLFREKVLPVFSGIAVVIGFATGVSQGSDSGLLVLAAMTLILGCFAGKEKEGLRHFIELLLLFCVSLTGLFALQHLFPERNKYQTAGYLFLTEKPWGLIFGVLLLCLYFFLFIRKNNCANGWTKTVENHCDNKLTGTADRGIVWTYRAWQILTGLSAAALVLYIGLLTFNTTHPGVIPALDGNALFTFNTSWGSSRGATWSIGIHTFLAQNFGHRLFGVGPDSMAAYLYQSDNSTLLAEVRATFGDKRLTNAHGEWITVLVNTGLMGLLSFAAMIISAVGTLFSRKQKTLAKACGLAVLCYTLHNIFSFEQMMNISQMYLVMGIGMAVAQKEERD